MRLIRREVVAQIHDMSRVWAEFPSHVQLPSGPFWPLGLLVLGPGIYALDNMLVTCSFGPNSPACILRPASVEFIK